MIVGYGIQSPYLRCLCNQLTRMDCVVASEYDLPERRKKKLLRWEII